MASMTLKHKKIRTTGYRRPTFANGADNKHICMAYIESSTMAHFYHVSAVQHLPSPKSIILTFVTTLGMIGLNSTLFHVQLDCDE